MAKQNQQKPEETQAPEAKSEKNELNVVNENPYSKTTENPVKIEDQNVESPSVNVEQIQQKPEEAQAPEENQPIKPILTDNVVDFNLKTTNKIQNKLGVVVGVSDMTAKILSGLDKNTNFVK